MEIEILHPTKSDFFFYSWSRIAEVAPAFGAYAGGTEFALSSH